MPRPRLCRRVYFMPPITYFKPAGVRMADLDETILTFDEVEAIRMVDCEGLPQVKVAKKMNVSQPTLSRLLTSARKKISDAIINGKAIRVQGGSYKMVQPRFRGRGMGRGFGGPAMFCVCPSCGHKAEKQRGVPCAGMQCPKCKGVMVRK